MLQSGLISKDQLPNKYKNEIHANEIILLAYYIAAINIEAVYHSLVGGEYQSFEGICLTDTFQLYEKDDLVSELLVDNSDRRKRQKELDIRVIIGNPPYSKGQKSANDNNVNMSYLKLDNRISETFSRHSVATSTKDLMNSYIRAIRWASDRIGESGIIGYVCPYSYVSGQAMDGMRKCLADEFSSIYIFNLKGDQYTKGEVSRKQGGKIFGGGSRTPITITILVKNYNPDEMGKIYLHDIDDYLSREQKLLKISEYKGVNGITSITGWGNVIPNKHYDWVNQRDEKFDEFIKLGDKKDKLSKNIFGNYSLGVGTNRDAWCYNYSLNALIENISNMIDFYNNELIRFIDAREKVTNPDKSVIDSFVSTDKTKIAWSSSLKSSFKQKKAGRFAKNKIIKSTYRPFTKQFLYYDSMFNHRIGRMPEIFPLMPVDNRIICVSGSGSKSGLNVLMCDSVVDLNLLDAGSQCFPLYLYELSESENVDSHDMFTSSKSDNRVQGGNRKDAISDFGLAHFKAAYIGETISKEDIFYYIYGLLHSHEYHESYADNITKQLPRIPCVKAAKDFWLFSQAGRDLADLHVNYETVDCYPATIDTGNKRLRSEDYYVTKMKFAKKGDQSTVVYNPYITIRDIPLGAYEYVVNGKSSLEWVMERQAVTTHKDSGIVNDANLWATETMGNAKYPLELFQRVITVSLETMKIVNALPKLDID